MKVEKLKSKILKKFKFTSFVGFPFFTFLFFISTILFAYHLVGLWIILIEFSIIIFSLFLSTYFKHKLRKLDKKKQ